MAIMIHCNKCKSEAKYFAIWYVENKRISGFICQKCYFQLLQSGIEFTEIFKVKQVTEYEKETQQRVLEFCELVKSGKSNKEISDKLNITTDTVSNYKAKYSFMFNEK